MSQQMSTDQEDFKTSDSLINTQDLTFMLWEYKPEDRTQRVWHGNVAGHGLY